MSMSHPACFLFAPCRAVLGTPALLCCRAACFAVHYSSPFFVSPSPHPRPQGVSLLSAIGDAVKGKAATLSNAAIANMEEARGVASSAKDLAGEATSLVKVCGRDWLERGRAKRYLCEMWVMELWSQRCAGVMLRPVEAGSFLWHLRQEVLGWLEPQPASQLAGR
jgi:hypothetical protein